MQYEVLVTDLTCYGGLFCVAGWAMEARRMIRPEPAGTDPQNESSRFWRANFAGPGSRFAIGNIVRFRAADPPRCHSYPHATEDRVVQPRSSVRLVKNLSQREMLKVASGSLYPTIDDMFGGHLVRQQNGKAYVPTNAETHSLGAIEVTPRQITFAEETTRQGKRQLRAKIRQSGKVYDLSVPAVAARTRFLEGGVAALAADAKAARAIHVRIGLCRPKPRFADVCYVQVNGLYFL